MTDFHPDEFYQIYSSTDENDACHRGDGPGGVFGAETTDCDSPISLINATFKWIDDNLKDSVDFVVWTGDSARHDSDEEIPRTESEVVKLNELLVTKFQEVFGKKDTVNDTDPTNDFAIPVVPTFGNNDIMPHNIFHPGPNLWTKKYASIWRQLIPEEQRHSFIRGGWFSVEVIPNKLAVLSLNTLYFFDSNTAVDGCAAKSQPGYEQMNWLRIQLEFLRQRGMKAILMGHVPPARTESKQSWDETCWQKYTLWMRQYRDVVAGSVYGHMNIDHFMLQDFEDINMKVLRGDEQSFTRNALDDKLTIQSSADYLLDLRAGWSHIPDPPKVSSKPKASFGYYYELLNNMLRRKKPKSKEERFLEKIGGTWGERYTVSLVSPSVVPNYYPTMRVIEYNISGLDALIPKVQISDMALDIATVEIDEHETEETRWGSKRKHHKSKKPKFTVPKAPSKSSPPGPAYSPQTFSFLGYTQYYANLTRINNDFTNTTQDNFVDEERWHGGKHKGKKPKEKSKKHHREFKYEVLYDTRNDSVFGLDDLTVRNYIDLAGRIGQYRPAQSDRMESAVIDDNAELEDGTASSEDANSDADTGSCGGHDIDLSKRTKHKKHGKKHKHRKMINKVWFTFVSRAYVRSKDEAELREEF